MLRRLQFGPHKPLPRIIFFEFPHADTHEIVQHYLHPRGDNKGVSRGTNQELRDGDTASLSASLSSGIDQNPHLDRKL